MLRAERAPAPRSRSRSAVVAPLPVPSRQSARAESGLRRRIGDRGQFLEPSPQRRLAPEIIEIRQQRREAWNRGMDVAVDRGEISHDARLFFGDYAVRARRGAACT